QLGWAAQNLARSGELFSIQELMNQVAFDHADAGWTGQMHEVLAVPRPDASYGVLSFIPPLVAVGPSLMGLANAVTTTQYSQVVDAASAWMNISNQVKTFVADVRGVAGSLRGASASEATDAAASVLDRLAATGDQFAANADYFAGKNTLFSPQMQLAGMAIQADAAIAQTILHPAARAAFEQAALAKHQVGLQGVVSQYLPVPMRLIDPRPAGSQEGTEAGFGSVNGSGERYDTAGVQWPKELVDMVSEGVAGPGSFRVVDGQLEAVNRISPKVVDAVNHAVEQRAQSLYGNGGMERFIQSIQPQDALTKAASVLQTGSPHTTAVVPSGMGWGTTAAGTGVNNLGHSVGGAANPTNWGGFGGGMVPQTSAASGMSGLRGGANALSGLSTNAGQQGSLGRMGSSGGLSGAVGAPGNAGASSFGRIPSGARGVGAGIGGLGSGGAMGTGSGSGTGAGAGSVTTSGVNGSGAGGVGGQQRGSGPMMSPGAAAGNGAGAKDKKIRAVTSKVELDDNRRALLGEPRAVVPGVIGNWVRED
ncbi:MAG: hypothetical protein SOW59_01575, partial [Corynebacterium sp.]|nr:hypothetical protein [Corynebacterium sp.]